MAPKELTFTQVFQVPILHLPPILLSSASDLDSYISREMDQNKSAFVIGIVGAVITLSAYSQTYMSPTQCITVGLVVLVFGLLVREGILPV
ncbi:uncharacterized protein [Henckelia pumila]|uniref:uncharacterized protein n=1 Tax=Henckelia pumila TaxID=405737 RepID=UPI003C6E5E30